MRTSKKIVSSVLAVCMLASTSVIAGAAATGSDATGATANPYVEAVEALDAEYTYTGNDLGATYSPEKTVFKVWSPTATEVTLNRYATGSDSEAGAAKLGTVAMEPLMDAKKRQVFGLRPSRATSSTPITPTPSNPPIPSPAPPRPLRHRTFIPWRPASTAGAPWSAT